MNKIRKIISENENLIRPVCLLIQTIALILICFYIADMAQSLHDIRVVLKYDTITINNIGH